MPLRIRAPQTPLRLRFRHYRIPFHATIPCHARTMTEGVVVPLFIMMNDEAHSGDVAN